MRFLHCFDTTQQMIGITSGPYKTRATYELPHLFPNGCGVAVNRMRMKNVRQSGRWRCRPRCGFGGLRPNAPSVVVSDAPGSLGLLPPVSAHPALDAGGGPARRDQSPSVAAGLLERRSRRRSSDDSDDDDADLGRRGSRSMPPTPPAPGALTNWVIIARDRTLVSREPSTYGRQHTSTPCHLGYPAC